MIPLFLSTYINKVDKKGRASVPSQFRSLLEKQNAELGVGVTGVVIFSSVVNNCIEACSYKKMEDINNLISKLDPLSDEADAFATSFLSSVRTLSFDPEGRIVLPQDLRDKYGIYEKVSFVGKGNKFEIWNSDDFDEHAKKSNDLATEKRSLLK